jgi:ABC-type nitrate/sulfonate/bicarbonate transport system permease component
MMHLAYSDSTIEELVAILRRSFPFQDLPYDLLRSISAVSRRIALEERATIYRVGDAADDLFVVASGKIEHALGPSSSATRLVKVVGAGDVIGWTAVLENQRKRLATATCLERSELVRINGNELLKLLEADKPAGDALMSRLASKIIDDFTVPEWVVQVREVMAAPEALSPTGAGLTPNGMDRMLLRLSLWLRNPRPYLMLLGFALLLGFWYLSVEVWKLPRFREMPSVTAVIKEWISRRPTYGLSIYTEEYYKHIWVSTWRVTQAFFLATVIGVPFGLMLGWSRKFRQYVFPVFELLRPIPALAWVPLAIVMFVSSESAVIYLTFLTSFFATALNTMLGVQSIDESYIRAAYCLGADRRQVFRHVIVPGALPFVFTGLQISMGVSWFSLVAAEMVSGQYGLGFVINTSYTMVRYPTIVIGMITLGIVGYSTSALVRIAGNYLMRWRTRELALGAQ